MIMWLFSAILEVMLLMVISWICVRVESRVGSRRLLPGSSAEEERWKEQSELSSERKEKKVGRDLLLSATDYRFGFEEAPPSSPHTPPLTKIHILRYLKYFNLFFDISKYFWLGGGPSIISTNATHQNPYHSKFEKNTSNTRKCCLLPPTGYIVALG